MFSHHIIRALANEHQRDLVPARHRRAPVDAPASRRPAVPGDDGEGVRGPRPSLRHLAVRSSPARLRRLVSRSQSGLGS